MNTKRKTNKGIVVGLVFAILFVIFHVIIEIVNDGETRGDFILWLFQILAYFFGGMIATNSQYQSQLEIDDPLSGIANAGRGNALVIFICLWVYILIRSIVLDDSGLFSGFGIFPSILFGVVDLTFAIIFGSISGSIIKNKYKDIY
jgi:hypothetical protein